MRVALIGGVNSSALTLHKLCEHGIEVVRVFGYKPTNPEFVSGYYDLEPLCIENAIEFTGFIRINEYVEEINSLNIDFLFVVGISQLVSENIITAPRLGAIGFHPTKLPKGRGRAPLAWLVHEMEEGAATFFMLEKVADAGAIVSQKYFGITQNDTAKSVEAKIYTAMALALDCFLPELANGEIKTIEQDDSLATEFGIRKPDDGLIDWSCSAYEIDRLIKCASEPHPGAFTYIETEQLPIKNSRLEHELKIKGVQGRILKVNNNEALVQTGNGLLWIGLSQQAINKVKIGILLGYKLELEMYELKKRVLELEEDIRRLL